MTRPVALTERDHRLIHTAWSLGYAPASTLLALEAPHIAPGTLRDRLRRLHTNNFLRQERFLGPVGGVFLYGIGRAGLLPGQTDPWRPSLAQLSHTLSVGAAVVALTRPGFGEPLTITSWKGEAELRDWVVVGAPFPDAEITWRYRERQGRWNVEVDCATESRAAWRRKLVRYLTAEGDDPVFTLTTSAVRARNLAEVGADLGVHVLAATLTDVQNALDPRVLDSRARRRHLLSVACLGEHRG